ncbi:MAG TPA: hypothetical protein VJZ51_02120, partial [Bacilli bacterium]|nr:hypothetical protein [Bacilli bacterium]
KHHNAYFVNPPWSKKTFPGRIETTKELIVTKEAISDMSYQEIYDLVVEKIYFNASEYNSKMDHSYRLNDISNLENVIYQCPNCNHQGLVSRKRDLFCPICQSSFIYDEKGRIGGYRIDHLFNNQQKTVQEQILKDTNYTLSSDVKLESFRNNRIVQVGFGILTLNQNEYIYQGVVDGVETTYHFDVKNTPTLPSDIGRNVQIYQGHQIYQFVFEDPKMPMMFVHAGEFMYHQFKNRPLN